MYLNVDMLYKLCNAIYKKDNSTLPISDKLSEILYCISCKGNNNIFQYKYIFETLILINKRGRIYYYTYENRLDAPITDEILLKYKIRDDKLKWINEYIDIKTLELPKLKTNFSCSKCKLSKEDCHKYEEDVNIIFLEPQYWDNWGHMVKVFNANDMVKGKAIIKNNTVYCASARSTIYSDTSDSILLTGVKIERYIDE